MALQIARLRRRWPPASARWPVTGAMAATTTPARNMARPSQVEPLSDPAGRSAATALARYGAKTKLTTIVLYAEDPQS